jgi:O-acetyl-ADP-ribose deacetylase (regulator of RNase III)
MINYVKGDATLPQGDGDKILIHICNDCGGWGRGFVNAINRRWKEPKVKVGRSRSIPEYIYRESKRPNFRRNTSHSLGDVSFAPIITNDGTNMWVANMVCQAGYQSEENPVPLQYDYLSMCLGEVHAFTSSLMDLGFKQPSIHLPKIGTGLAGGNWNSIEGLLTALLPTEDITVYEL